MRGLVPPSAFVVVLLATAFAGCIQAGPGTQEDPAAALESLEVYEYRYPGDDVAFPTVPYGWMARITNVVDRTIAFVVVPHHLTTTWGPAGNMSWETFDRAKADVLLPGESRVYLFQATYTNTTNETGFSVAVLQTPIDPGAGFDDVPMTEEGIFMRGLDWQAAPNPVRAGQHVQTKTVGVWLNGTSFYTNIPELNASAAFPAGYDRSGFAGDPLPVYVYGDDRTEQPAGSKDTCHYTTVPGYNALLKTQAEHGTNVRWLAPEEAYTRPGAEEHSLYGDVLVFMNTVVRHEGTVGPTERGPDPDGDCFDPDNTSPVPLPPVPSLS